MNQEGGLSPFWWRRCHQKTTIAIMNRHEAYKDSVDCLIHSVANVRSMWRKPTRRSETSGPIEQHRPDSESALRLTVREQVLELETVILVYASDSQCFRRSDRRSTRLFARCRSEELTELVPCLPFTLSPLARFVGLLQLRNTRWARHRDGTRVDARSTSRIRRAQAPATFSVRSPGTHPASG